MRSENPKIVEASTALVDIFGYVKLIEQADIHGLDWSDMADNCDRIRKKLIEALNILKD